MSGVNECTCGVEDRFYCEVHVSCDDGCKALVYPETPDQYTRALVHWKKHSHMLGCSHGC